MGQHFLINHSVILDALAAADVQAGDRILEIGPGTGNLTVELLKAGPYTAFPYPPFPDTPVPYTPSPYAPTPYTAH
jgi:hypothetical protein